MVTAPPLLVPVRWEGDTIRRRDSTQMCEWVTAHSGAYLRRREHGTTGTIASAPSAKILHRLTRGVTLLTAAAAATAVTYIVAQSGGVLRALYYDLSDFAIGCAICAFCISVSLDFHAAAAAGQNHPARRRRKNDVGAWL